jgi:glycosyltransferase involved in cell wall biosynthesis
MKIIYYTDQVYLHGGIEKVLAQKLNFLAALRGYEVHLVTSEQKEKPFCYPISTHVFHHDLAINYFRNKSYFSPTNLRKVPKHINRLKNKLNEIKPDVLIICNYAFDFYFIPFISEDITTIKEYHSSRYHYIKSLPEASLLSKLLYKLNTWIEQKYTHIVVLNSDEKAYYKSNNVVVIPNFIEREKRTSRLVEIPRQKNIIAAGRIAEVKQFDHLIKAWSRIAHKYSDWKVAIYGDGDVDLLHRLNIEIKDLGLSNITLCGATADLAAIMQESSIFALTSSTECFPMVLLEAMSHGLPIVSYDCPHGPRNIIDRDSGVLVAKNDVQKLAEALSHFMDNEEERKDIATAAMQKVKEYSEANVMGQWETLFANLIDFKKEIKHT